MERQSPVFGNISFIYCCHGNFTHSLVKVLGHSKSIPVFLINSVLSFFYLCSVPHRLLFLFFLLSFSYIRKSFYLVSYPNHTFLKLNIF